MGPIGRAALAEAWGTFLLTLIGPGAITALAYLDFGPTGIAASARLGFIGFAHAFALIAAAYSIGHVSGAHINPAVTIAHAATRRIRPGRVIPYIIAQLIGATIASLVQLGIWAQSPLTVAAARATYLGNTSPGFGFGSGAALFAEIVGTAILVYTIFGATDRAAPRGMAGLTIGFVLAGIIWMFGPVSGASLNPARTWGPTLVSAYFSLAPFGTLWIYILGPILGGLLGGFLYDVTRMEKSGTSKESDSSEVAEQRLAQELPRGLKRRLFHPRP